MSRLYHYALISLAVAAMAIPALAQRPTMPKMPSTRATAPVPPSSNGNNSTWAHQIWKHLHAAHTDLQSAGADPQSHKGKALSAIEQAVNELAAGVNNPKVASTVNWSQEAATDQKLGNKADLVQANSHLQQAAGQCGKITGDLGGHLPNVERLIKQAQSEISADMSESKQSK